MKIKEIEAFDAFMKHGTTKAAAETLGISQSMVSRLLIGLEEELGFALFKRARNQLSPTSEAFLYHASVLRLMASIRDTQKTQMLLLIIKWVVSSSLLNPFFAIPFYSM
ncbi:LysR family transcriptional regulator [Halomonas sp. BDJS001]|uniref:LysR family transcriptional regulator n=1 Tax=Halomonas sp. BDJS001 TaxID=2992143 RepID=UPI00223671EC|nr:LysR family transcriptional regulator [Halomonas sp. BDJS001]UZH09915.1 LysR family transcriptional regulator [Halomonas sp. BDJS001]